MVVPMKATSNYKMIAVDSSLTCSGVAIYVNGKLKNSFTIDSKTDNDNNDKLIVMLDRLFGMFSKEHPGTIVVEQEDVSRNAKTNRQLNMLIGAILGYCILNDIEFVQLKPSVWRSLISSEKKGRKRVELKQWSINTVKNMYNKTVDDNEADAILIGQARINMFVTKN